MTNNRVRYKLTNDHLFKAVFEKKQFALSLLKELKIIDNEVTDFEQENSVEDGGVNFKGSNFDIKIKLINKDVETYINMEMQNTKPKYDILDRLALYISKLISRSQPKGIGYEKKQCIVLAILNYTLIQDSNYIRTLRFKDDYTTVIPNYQIIILELTKSEFCDKKELKDWLEIFTADQFDGYKKGDGIMKELAEYIENLNKERRFQAFVDRAEMEENDRITNEKILVQNAKQEGLEEGLEQGMAQGLEQGMAQGLSQGFEKAQIEIAIKLKKSGVSSEVIAETTGLDLTVINNL